MDEKTMAEVIELLLDGADAGETRVRMTRQFEDAGIGRYNEGVVVDMADGTQFQVTVVRSR